MPYYEAAKFEKITLIEPDPELAKRLKMKWPYADVIEAAAGAKSGKATLYLMPVSNMNTMVQGLDAPKGTTVVKMVRLKDVAKTANVAVVDVQGLELDVLKGADLERFDIVMVETCTVEDATMASSYAEVTAYMSEHGFDVLEYWTRDYQWVAKWGRKRRHTQAGEVRDVIYVKRAKEETPAPATTEAEPEERENRTLLGTGVELVDAAGFPGYEDVKLEESE
jgi:FkbM family methyltransferase